MYNGIINVYKEKGFTSHDVVAKLRGISKQKKIGHTGTLDPDAVGVLPVCLGSATKLCDLLTDKDKEYIAVLRLGVVTDTQDLTGKVLSEVDLGEFCQNKISLKEQAVSEESLQESFLQSVREAVSSFQGEQLQIPPMYSALKVNGKKLYEYAREGKEVERKPRPITVHEIEILEEQLPELTIRVHCSKGTYIRTICHDIGQKLGCGAAMASLTRTRVSSFSIGQALKLSELQLLADQGRLAEAVLPVDQVFEALPAVKVRAEGMKALLNGNQLKKTELCMVEAKQNTSNTGLDTVLARKSIDADTGIRVYGIDDLFYGVYQYHEDKDLFCPLKMFFPEK